MRATKNNFPNPVLATGRGDYIESCSFSTSFNKNNIVIGEKSIDIHIEFALKCQGLQALMESEDAVVVVMVKCSKTSFSRLFCFPKNESQKTIEIPKFDVDDNIEIKGAVIAARDIEKFSCPGEFNELFFEDSTFKIRKGDILAIEDSEIILLDHPGPISSIFCIIESEKTTPDIDSSFLGEKITIFLKKELYELYYKFKDFNDGRYAAGVVVYPVLVEALHLVLKEIQAEDNDSFEETSYSHYRWFRTIERKAKEAQIDLSTYEDSVTSLADRLLGGISLDALKKFKNTLDSENEIDDDETQVIGESD